MLKFIDKVVISAVLLVVCYAMLYVTCIMHSMQQKNETCNSCYRLLFQDCVNRYQTLLEINLAFTSRKISWQLSLKELYCIIQLCKFRLKLLTVKSRMYCISHSDFYNCSSHFFSIKISHFWAGVCVYLGWGG